MKILVVESNEENSKRICKLFTDYGKENVCERASDMDRGLELALANKYDLIIVAHKGMRTATKNMITKLRLECMIPLIVVSNDTDIETAVELLNSGADSYLPYVFDDNMLLAVANSVLRRYYRDFGNNVYEFKNLKVDFFERSVKIDGENIGMVAKMYEVFSYLVRHKGIVISKETLFNRVWGFESETTISVVEVYVSKLRKMLEKGGLEKHLITIKNAGYCWSEKDNFKVPNN